MENKEDEQKDILDFVSKLKEKKYNLQMEIEAFLTLYSAKIDQSEPSDTLFNLTDIKSRYNKYQDIKINENMLNERQNETAKKLNELEESIGEYFSKYFDEINQSYVAYAQEIKIKKGLLLKQKQDFETKLKTNEDYKKANKIEEIQEQTTYNMAGIKRQEIEEKIKNMAIEINKLNDEKNYLKNQIELLESTLDTILDVESQKEELSQEIEEMTEKCDILEKTKKYLEMAKEQFSSHYLNNMKQNFIKNLKLINGEELDINLDVNLNVMVNECGAGKEINYFSTGYKDLIYICMRLSLINSLFESEKPFIILDDPFVNLDENKIKNATNLLKNISNDYQIIYFICHESRR